MTEESKYSDSDHHIDTNTMTDYFKYSDRGDHKDIIVTEDGDIGW